MLTNEDIVAAINAASVTAEELTAVVAGGSLLVKRNVILAQIEVAKNDLAQTTEDKNAQIQVLMQQLAAIDATINSRLGSI